MVKRIYSVRWLTSGPLEIVTRRPAPPGAAPVALFFSARRDLCFFSLRLMPGFMRYCSFEGRWPIFGTR